MGERSPGSRRYSNHGTSKGLLAIVYGTAMTRVASLRRGAVRISGVDTFVSLGREPVKLPRPVGSLMRQLLDDAKTEAPGDWLFPGRKLGHHLTTAALTTPFHRRGIKVRASKHVALVNLARNMPASVLADLLGLSIEAAAR